MKRILYLFILGIALTGLIGQTTSVAATSVSQQMGIGSQMDMLCCPQLQKQQKSGDSDRTEGCCSSDCPTMVQSSQSNAMLDQSASLPGQYFGKTIQFFAAIQFAPPGQTHMPIIRPPITS